MVLTQVVRPGAPVVYGGFTCNVDMQSGAPAFGTPEYMRTAMVGGQLARRYGVPVPLVERVRRQRRRRPGGLRERLLAVGRDHGRGQPADARRRLDGGRPPRRLREGDPRRRAAGHGRGLPRPGRSWTRRRSRLDAMREVGPGRALLRRRAHAGALPDRLPQADAQRLAELGVLGGGRLAASCPARPTASGRSCWPPTSRRRWTRPSARSSTPSSPAASPRAASRPTTEARAARASGWPVS